MPVISFFHEKDQVFSLPVELVEHIFSFLSSYELHHIICALQSCESSSTILLIEIAEKVAFVNSLICHDRDPHYYLKKLSLIEIFYSACEKLDMRMIQYTYPSLKQCQNFQSNHAGFFGHSSRYRNIAPFFRKRCYFEVGAFILATQNVRTIPPSLLLQMDLFERRNLTDIPVLAAIFNDDVALLEQLRLDSSSDEINEICFAAACGSISVLKYYMKDRTTIREWLGNIYEYKKVLKVAFRYKQTKSLDCILDRFSTNFYSYVLSVILLRYGNVEIAEYLHQRISYNPSQFFSDYFDYRWNILQYQNKYGHSSTKKKKYIKISEEVVSYLVLQGGRISFGHLSSLTSLDLPVIRTLCRLNYPFSEDVLHTLYTDEKLFLYMLEGGYVSLSDANNWMKRELSEKTLSSISWAKRHHQHYQNLFYDPKYLITITGSACMKSISVEFLQNFDNLLTDENFLLIVLDLLPCYENEFETFKRHLEESPRLTNPVMREKVYALYQEFYPS